MLITKQSPDIFKSIYLVLVLHHIHVSSSFHHLVHRHFNGIRNVLKFRSAELASGQLLSRYIPTTLAVIPYCSITILDDQRLHTSIVNCTQGIIQVEHPFRSLAAPVTNFFNNCSSLRYSASLPICMVRSSTSTLLAVMLMGNVPTIRLCQLFGNWLRRRAIFSSVPPISTRRHIIISEKMGCKISHIHAYFVLQLHLHSESAPPFHLAYRVLLTRHHAWCA